MSLATMNDRQVQDAFDNYYKKGVIFLLLGASSSFIILGIPIAIYGLCLLFKSQQVKNEMQRRIRTGGYNQYGQ